MIHIHVYNALKGLHDWSYIRHFQLNKIHERMVTKENWYCSDTRMSILKEISSDSNTCCIKMRIRHIREEVEPWLRL